MSLNINGQNVVTTDSYSSTSHIAGWEIDALKRLAMNPIHPQIPFDGVEGQVLMMVGGHLKWADLPKPGFKDYAIASLPDEGK